MRFDFVLGILIFAGSLIILVYSSLVYLSKSRMVIREIINPKWEKGHKKGDYKGPGFLRTYRPPDKLRLLMGDVLAVCKDIRHGVFFRRPGSFCNHWCRFREACVQGVEIEIEELKLAGFSNHDFVDD